MVVKNFSPLQTVKEAISKLKPNEIKVVSGRFGIETDHKTLSAIGKDLKLSRERIRQVEKEALRKIAKEIVNENNQYITDILGTLELNGGITAQHRIAEKFLEEKYSQDKNEFNALHLIFVLLPELVKIERTKELEAGWMLATLSKDDAIKVINDWVKHLLKSKNPETMEVLIDANPDHKKYKTTFLSELPEISKKLITTETGRIGLASWPEVNPRNVRDKIYFVLKKANKPLHFDQIALDIASQKFDKKRIVKATVHNELIADTRFVLVGRGIYALSEWGYKEGTVAEIITSILKNKPLGMPADEIIAKVAKQRVVKRNTILINLQTKPMFKRLKSGAYILS